MVSFVEDKKIDAIHRYERVMKALAKDFSSADNHHVFIEVLLPKFSAPQIAAHIATKHVHWLVKIGLEDCMLLENQGYRIDLASLARTRSYTTVIHTRKKDIRLGLPIALSSNS